MSNMIQPNLVLIGAGGHSRACIDVIEKQATYKIAGLVGLPEQISKEILGYTVFATDFDLASLIGIYSHALITIGQIKTAAHRARLYQQAVDQGFEFPTVISPTAYVSRHAHIGAGTIVMHGAIVNAGARIGRNCIINSRALVEHDTTVGDHCHVSTGAILNGDVAVGAGTFIGSSCCVREGLIIGEGCVIGLGAVIRHNVADRTQVMTSRK